ncbi:MAG: acyl-[acyl-carrier-protein]--UDP-N-acetylglucosamine O-acyltransferase, partial [Candidatus Krumholzibacteria bacterium]|nr:acyl-[acyl-carrier-protein]--UDP-N-acetylglucosamine O-acyltransferase [Candidatus Krumholzibacteria bacterium]
VCSSDLKVCGLNSVGLQRRGFDAARLAPLRQAYRLLFRGGYNVSQALERIESEVGPTPEVAALLRFIRESQRGIIL